MDYIDYQYMSISMRIDLERKDRVYINTIVKFYHTNILLI